MGKPVRRHASGQETNLHEIGQNITNSLRRDGFAGAHEEGVRFATSMESLSAVSRENVMTHLDNTVQVLQDYFTGFEGSAKPSMEQLFAGAVVMNVMNDPVAYARSAMKVDSNPTASGVTVVPVDGAGYDYTELAVGLESFSNETLKKFGGLSVAYNIQAARQDPFCERLFRTTTVSADSAGVDVSVSSMVVMNHFLHQPNGDKAEFGRKLLLRAAMDANILSDESTRIVPEYIEDETDHLLAPVADITPRTIKLGKRDVVTQPIKVGVDFDMLGLGGSSIMRVNGQLDNTDGLDRMAAIDDIYAQIADGDILKFSVRNLPRSLFYKAPQGMDRELTLSFTSSILTLNKDTKLANGSDPTNATLTKIVADELVVSLELGLTGTLNLETGNTHVDARPVRVRSVHNKAGESLSLKTGVGKDIVDGLAQLAIKYYDPNLRLTNANRRERGLQLSRTEYTERYPVLLGPPIIFPSPLAEERGVDDMNMLLAATRIRNSNNAITRLENYAEDLGRWMRILEDTDEDNIVPEIEGIGRYYVYPWHRDETVHLPDHIQSIKTSERMADISELLVNRLRDGVWEAYRDTNIQTAMDALTGYSGKKPIVFIGTDSKLSRFIVVQGDPRTLGDGLNFEKYESTDRRVFGKIYYTFVTDGEGIDPLNFGSHIWIPELISAVNVSRNNSHYDEAMVQNRSRHIVHLPILGVIRVTGLEEVLNNRVPFPVETVDPTDDGEEGTGGGDTGNGSGNGGSTTPDGDDTGAGTNP